MTVACRIDFAIQRNCQRLIAAYRHGACQGWRRTAGGNRSGWRNRRSGCVNNHGICGRNQVATRYLCCHGIRACGKCCGCGQAPDSGRGTVGQCASSNGVINIININRQRLTIHNRSCTSNCRRGVVGGNGVDGWHHQRWSTDNCQLAGGCIRAQNHVACCISHLGKSSILTCAEWCRSR